MKKIISIPPNYFYLSIIFSFLTYFAFPGLNLINYPYNLSGLFLILIGLYFFIKSWRLFKKNNTPETFKKSTYLVAESLYKYSRNPMYLGAIVVLLGFSLLVGNIISFIFPAIFFLVLNYMFVPFEEEKMEQIFGEKYLNYKKEVKRWI